MSFLRRAALQLFACLLIFVLNGCMRDVMHQPALSPAPPVVFFTPASTYRGPDASARRQDRNHATVEFLEDGRYADPNCRSVPRTQPCQIDDVVAFVHESRVKANAEGVHLTVILFVHGNENNATDFTDNYPHFRQLLNCLNLGEQAYKQQYAPLGTFPRKTLTCDGFMAPKAERYAGVFIGWRGRHSKSVFNLRQRVAFQISEGAEIVPAFYRIRDAAKENASTTEPSARFVAFGHSFGGLLLEQVAIRIYKEAYERTDGSASRACSPGSNREGLKPFADGIVTINAAINSVPAERFVKFLRAKQFCDVDQTKSVNVTTGLYPPILVSLVSKNDFWSSVRGSFLRHNFGYEKNLAMGRPQPLTTDKAVVQDEPEIATIFQSTPSHTTYLQNLCYLRADHTPGEAFCENEMLGTSDDLQPPPYGFALPHGSGVARNLYVRYACRMKGNDRTLRYDRHIPDCQSGNSFEKRSETKIWNTTPYWIGAVDDEIIKNHDDIWNKNFISLLKEITFSSASKEQSEVIPAPPSGHVVPRIDWAGSWPLSQ